MAADVTASTLNLLLRGGTVGVLLLVAGMVWRDQRGLPAARLGATFAIGVAAATLAAIPGIAGGATPWAAALTALAAGNMFVFWLFTRALFDDEFGLARWQLGVWAALAALGAANCLLVAPREWPIANALGLILGTMPVAWALLAIAQSLASWRVDLVEGRRRLRTIVVAATALYTVGQLLAAWAFGLPLRAAVESPLNAAGTAALTMGVAWLLLQMRAGALFAAPPTAATEPAPVVPVAAAEPPEPRQVATLMRLMTQERVYREPSLTVAALALRMGLPEHRLRKLINQSLGHRNFNVFLNAHRIEDAKRALRDAAQADVPVLTIAMDAGFQSLGPFNRAFKADTGVTPSEYRRGVAQRAPATIAGAPAEAPADQSTSGKRNSSTAPA